MKTFNNLEECILEIKRLRVQTDAMIQTANVNKTSAETTLAWRELQLAKSWLGKLLGDVAKTPSPYPQVSAPEFIHPTQEVARFIPHKFDSTLSMCNSQRNIIEEAIEEFRDLWYAPNLEMLIDVYNDKVGSPRDQEDIKRVQENRINLKFDYYNLIQEHLEQAKIWYGFEIANLRTI